MFSVKLVDWIKQYVVSVSFRSLSISLGLSLSFPQHRASPWSPLYPWSVSASSVVWTTLWVRDVSTEKSSHVTVVELWIDRSATTLGQVTVFVTCQCKTQKLSFSRFTKRSKNSQTRVWAGRPCGGCWSSPWPSNVLLSFEPLCVVRNSLYPSGWRWVGKNLSC